MSSFLATEHYHPAVILIVGLLTFAGIVGLGRGWLRLFRLTLPCPWRDIAGVLVGIHPLLPSVRSPFVGQPLMSFSKG